MHKRLIRLFALLVIFGGGALLAHVIYSRNTAVIPLAAIDDLRLLEKYDGRKVRLRGYLTVIFEGTAVYQDFKAGGTFDASKAVWLEMRSQPRLYLLFMVKGEATVSGTMRIDKKPFGAFKATLDLEQA